MAQLPKGSARAKPVRVFQDGDFVFAHTDYDFFGPKIGFDIFRFENGKIVEHWDNLQEKPAKRQSERPHDVRRARRGRPTSTRPRPTRRSCARFVDDILVNGRMEKLAGYFDGDQYVQHNPQIADGLSGLGAALAGDGEERA